MFRNGLVSIPGLVMAYYKRKKAQVKADDS